MLGGDVGGVVVDCDDELVVVDAVVDVAVSLLLKLGVTVTVTDAGARVCEIVFAASAGLECQVNPAGPSTPAPSGPGASSAWQRRGNDFWPGA